MSVALALVIGSMSMIVVVAARTVIGCDVVSAIVIKSWKIDVIVLVIVIVMLSSTQGQNVCGVGCVVATAGIVIVANVVLVVFVLVTDIVSVRLSGLARVVVIAMATDLCIGLTRVTDIGIVIGIMCVVNVLV